MTRKTRKPETRFDEYINRLLFLDLTLPVITAMVNKTYGVVLSRTFVHNRAKVQPNYGEWRRLREERRPRRPRRNPETRFDAYINRLLLQNLTLPAMTAKVNETCGLAVSTDFVHNRAEVQPRYKGWLLRARGGKA